MSRIECIICALESRVPTTNLKEIKEILQIDEFHIITWLEVLDAGL
jgi:hypothetical protein